MRKQSALAFANHLAAVMEAAHERFDLTQSELQWAVTRARNILEHKAKRAGQEADFLQRVIDAKERQNRDEEAVR
jgi:hypothetical protein